MIIDFPNLVTPQGVARKTLSEVVDTGVSTTQASASAVRALDKTARRHWFKQAANSWPCISMTEGVSSKLRISKENPPQFLHGFLADYDGVGKQLTVGDLTGVASRLAYPPAAGGASLGGDGAHAVWVFEEPIACLGNLDYAKRLLGIIYQKLRAGNFLQGFDDGFKNDPGRLLSIDPHNFGWLTEKGEGQVVDKESTRMWAADVVSKVEFEGPVLDLKKVHEHVERLFPGRWQGPFEVGCRGVRFWDSASSDASAATITPTGVAYFSDGGGFRSWASILGRDVESVINANSLREATAAWYYDSTNQDYVLQDPVTGDFLIKNRTQLMDRLETGPGITDPVARKRAMIFIEDHKRVAGVVALANQPRGVLKQGGQSYINTTNTSVLKAAPGDCGFILGLLHAMFGEEQFPYFVSWLRESFIRMQSGKPSYAQALFMAGDVQSGKSLLQYRVLTPLFGGKSADPMPYLLGEAGFNAELADAGHWIVSDQEGSGNHQQKAAFTQKIKAIAANPAMSVCAKYKTPVTLFLNSRITFSLNKLSECFSVLPRLGEDIVDKLMIFDIQPHTYLRDLSKDDIEPLVEEQLPAFAQFLLDYEIPEHVRAKGRYPIKSYHNKGLVDVSKASQDHAELIGWIHLVFNTQNAFKDDDMSGGIPCLTGNQWLGLINSLAGGHYGLTVRKLNAQFQSLARQYPDAIFSTLDPTLRLHKYSVNYPKLTQIHERIAA